MQASQVLQLAVMRCRDSTLPGAAVLMLNLKRNEATAKDYLEGTVLKKWEVSLLPRINMVP